MINLIFVQYCASQTRPQVDKIRRHRSFMKQQTVGVVAETCRHQFCSIFLKRQDTCEQGALQRMSLFIEKYGIMILLTQNSSRFSPSCHRFAMHDM